MTSAQFNVLSRFAGFTFDEVTDNNLSRAVVAERMQATLNEKLGIDFEDLHLLKNYKTSERVVAEASVRPVTR